MSLQYHTSRKPMTDEKQIREEQAATGRKVVRELCGLFLIFWGLLVLLSLISYDQRDPGINHAVSHTVVVQNSAGLFGAYLSGLLVDIFGVASLVWPAVFIAWGAGCISTWFSMPWWRWCGFILLTVCLLSLGAAWNFGIGDVRGGGMLGMSLYQRVTTLFNPLGSVLIWLFLLFFSLELALGIAWLSLIRTGWQILKVRLEKRAFSWPTIPTTFPKFSLLSRFVLKKGSPSSPEEFSGDIIHLYDIHEDMPLPGKKGVEEISSDDVEKHEADDLEQKLEAPGLSAYDSPSEQVNTQPDRKSLALQVSAPKNEGQSEEDENSPSFSSWTKEKGTSNPIEAADCCSKDMPPLMDLRPVSSSEKAEQETEHTLVHPVLDKAEDEAASNFIGVIVPLPHRKPPSMPPLDLLHPPQASDALPDSRMLAEKSRELMNCLADFNVQGELIRVTPGPVITLFEIRPAPGVRVGRITNLNDDLARSLRAEAVRIQAPVPGSDTVGIEIPNAVRATVNFRELVQSPAFQNSESPLTMALGKDIEGRPAVRDLSTMPHALVAGTTGSGKSVCLNSILVSFLYKSTPDQVKLMLIDPKRVEMSMYRDMPHLVHPVVTEMTLAKTALDWAVNEMERRYDCLARLGVKNIKDFNKKLLQLGADRPPHLNDLVYLPYLVIVIDELADLMMTAGKEVEACLVRLAQLARAAGIHLIVATQRPSVDVVTGILRANFPCRIAFQVANKYDSRTILDNSGAEKLLGKGDMLFKPSGGKLLRLHGPFVTDEEVEAVVEHWKKQRAPQYDVDFSEWATTVAENKATTTGAGGSVSSEEEALYVEAVAFVREQGRMSISLLQRRFRIGFNKAARFVERMEQEGILPPASRSNKARQVRSDI